MGADAYMARSDCLAFGNGDIDAAVATTSDSAETVLPEQPALGLVLTPAWAASRR